MAARTFGALRCALDKLRSIYSTPLQNMTSFGRFYPTSPAQSSYTDIADNDQLQQIIYNSNQPLSHKGIYFGNTVTGRLNDLCIKFCKTYSPDVHHFCASKGYAPELYCYEVLPGGWRMVVMDRFDLNPAYEVYFKLGNKKSSPAGLNDAIRAFVLEMHENNFVHGDLRSTNIVFNAANGHFMIYDFNWAGVIGTTRYPMNVNRKSIKRPEGAIDGELVRPEHDLAMLDYMFAAPAGDAWHLTAMMDDPVDWF